MSHETLVQVVIALGLFFGSMLRTTLPYLKKLKKAELGGKKLDFAPKYYGTAAISVIGSIFVVVEGFTMFNLTYPELTVGSVLAIVPTAIMFGYSFNSMLNRFFDIEPEPVDEEKAEA
jgi:hypothetical protein